MEFKWDQPARRRGSQGCVSYTKSPLRCLWDGGGTRMTISSSDGIGTTADPGTPSSISICKSPRQGLTKPLVYLHRYGLDIYTNRANICSFIRQDKS